MGIFSKLRNEFIDIIEWLDPSQDTIVYRFERYQNEIKNGAKLTVRESQVAVFVNQGQIADIFTPGMYTLTTQNLPLLSTLKGWKYGFDSPFQAEVYFINMKQFIDQKWGTKNPITLSDDRFGMLEIRAFGTYAFRVTDVKKFLLEIVGTDGTFTSEEVSAQLRSLIVTRFTDACGEGNIPVEKYAGSVNELSDLLMAKIKPEMDEYGISLTKFLCENISMPEEIKKEIFEYSRLDKLNMSQLAQFNAARAINTAAANEGGAGMGMGMGVGMGVGAGMGNMMAGLMGGNQGNAAPNASGSVPPPIPGASKFFIAVNGAQQGPFDLSQIQQMISGGQFSPETLVWKEGMAAWLPAGQVEELKGLFGSVPPPIPQ